MYDIDMIGATWTIHIMMSHRAYCPADWTWDSRYNKWRGYHLWTIAAGRGMFDTPAGSFQLRRGDCFLLDTTEVYLGRGGPDHPLVVPAVNFELRDRRGRLVRLDRGRWPLYRHMSSYGFIEELLNRCVLAHAGGRMDEAEHWLRGALQEMHAQDSAPRYVESDEYAPVIDELCAQIRETPSSAPDIDAMSERAHCSADHFIRVFKRRVGCTPVEFILRVRTDAAKHLLRFSSHSIKRIASLLGYSDQYYFSRQFKERVGVAPSVFRKRA